MWVVFQMVGIVLIWVILASLPSGVRSGKVDTPRFIRLAARQEASKRSQWSRPRVDALLGVGLCLFVAFLALVASVALHSTMGVVVSHLGMVLGITIVASLFSLPSPRG